ncbi:MAG: ABC transporter permease [Phreatobacter sp.]|uniref:ABC transporter permease n=1 Tax=Phreatobacter sp. TaxID=1966341 RepID=UPI001A59AC94|nr:ABC transporter permease [Phreatobacter sp.]MBL8571304.1 ABC transporter permease [Phreatobacter sp.]
MAAPRPRSLAPVLVPLAVFALFFATWEYAVHAGWLRRLLFPPPSRLVSSTVELVTSGVPVGKLLADHLGATLARIGGGFLVAVALAIPIGLLIGSRPVLDRMTQPIIGFCRSVATLSLLPLALVWFGIGEASKIFLIGYGCFWVMLSNVVAAVRLVDPVLLRAARTMDTPARRIFMRVILPAALPRIAAGARIALGVGFMVIVGAEMIGTTTGLGALIMEARTFYRTDVTMVGMATLGLLGLAIAAGMTRLEHALMPWLPREREAGR